MKFLVKCEVNELTLLLLFLMQGYQMMRNAKLYGSIIPSDVHALRITDLSLGERVELQILALTDHPVGRDDVNAKDYGEGE